MSVRAQVERDLDSKVQDIQRVAAHLDACFRDQALSGQGWDGLQQHWLSAARCIAEDADEPFARWCDDCEAEQPEIGTHLLAAAACLLNISDMVEAMRRGAR